MRAGGILLPVFSLPGHYGIGSFSKEAFDFIDFLKKSGQSYWQILPLGATGYGDSPYQAFSTFAGNPYFISLEGLYEDGLLTAEELKKQEMPLNEEYIDYSGLYEKRWAALRTAYKRFVPDKGFKAFCKENDKWLSDYIRYRVIKDLHKGLAWHEWEDKYKKRNKNALRAIDGKYSDELLFYAFVEYKFYTQWIEIKEYANRNGIRIIGDLPIYVSADSSDTWSHPELFDYDKNFRPVNVAGCPPDVFSNDGQLWGNPVYRWERHKEDGYKWWIERLRHSFKLCDVIRLDHFRGFAGYYTIPYGSETAKEGEWKEGPGHDFFRQIKKALGSRPVIAEDLGFLTEDVFELIEKTGYPGMKILEFAFDESHESIYLPHKYDRNCVVYTGTHDNDTLIGWIKSTDPEVIKYLRDYLDKPYADDHELAWGVIRLANASTADTCIIPMQDYLCLGNEARINVPSTLGNNWKWRMKPEAMSDELAGSIKKLAVIYGRDNKAAEDAEAKDIVKTEKAEKTEE